LVPGTLQVFDDGVLKALGTDYIIGYPGLSVPSASCMGLYLR
jgi:hypothetical protein